MTPPSIKPAERASMDAESVSGDASHHSPEANADAAPGPIGLATIVEEGGSDAMLQRFAVATAALMRAHRCSIMLAEEDMARTARAMPTLAAKPGPPSGAPGAPGAPTRHLVVHASTEDLSAIAPDQAVAAQRGIADHVLATACSLRVDDIAASVFADRACRPGDGCKSFLCAPILIDGRAVGVLNLSGRRDGAAFDAADQTLLEMTALTIGKSMQVSQLRSMLDSRFAQMAIMREAGGELDRSLAAGLPNPDQVAKLMAKSFYKEMTRAGFGSRQIISAASEIIAQLSGNLQRHSRRLQRTPGAIESQAKADAGTGTDVHRMPGALPD